MIGGAAILQVSTYDGRDIDVATTGAVVIADLALVWTKDALPAPSAWRQQTLVRAHGSPLSASRSAGR